MISTYFEKFAKRPPPPLLPEFEELLLFPVLGVVPTVSCGPSILDEVDVLCTPFIKEPGFDLFPSTTLLFDKVSICFLFEGLGANCCGC